MDLDPLPSGNRKSTSRLLWVLFSLFVVYGTTVPFSFSHGPDSLDAFFRKIRWHPLGVLNGDLSTPDLVQNVLLFIPFGFLGYLSLIEKRSRLKRAVIVLMGAGLSVFVEFLQIFTTTRWPALSDVIFNTLGTAVGVFAGMRLKGWVTGIQGRPEFRRWLEAPSAFPALVFVGLAVAGSWEPFDFALDVSAVAYKARIFLTQPFDFTWPNDELATFIRFLLATLFSCRLAGEAGLSRPVRWVAPLLVVAAVGLECTQVVITSRSPTFQDAVTSILGILGGVVAFGFPGFREHPWKWGAVGTLAIVASAALADLHPFRFEPNHAGFNWMPFLAEYARTNFVALGNFMETCMTWFPLGFLLGYFFPGSLRAMAVSLFLAVAMSFGLEWAQGWVTGRHSDITDVIGAAAGSLAGSLVLTRGWRTYLAYAAVDLPPSRNIHPDEVRLERP